MRLTVLLGNVLTEKKVCLGVNKPYRNKDKRLELSLLLLISHVLLL